MITIGFLELNSIAKGILAADMMLSGNQACLCKAQLSRQVSDFNNRGSFSRGISFEDR